MPTSERRIALLLEYDGSGYAGSQLQPHAVTVQSVLESAVARTTGAKVRVAFAGRTDAGCHARGQVASFLTESSLDSSTLQRAFNAWLPRDVVVREAVDVAPAFDPRRQALRRHYRYIVSNAASRPALDRERAWYIPQPLDAGAMSEAAQTLIGVHDFAAFASRMEDRAASTVRALFSFEVSRRGDSVCFDVVANAFLPHQVRRMVGALVEVGKGRRSVDEFAALLAGPPASAGPAAPARGLYLMAVEYEKPLFGTAWGGTLATAPSSGRTRIET